MNMEFNEAIIGALAGAIVMVMTALLGRESVGNWLLSGERRETSAVNAMIAMLDKAIDGMVSLASQLQRIGTELAGHDRDASLRWQQERVEFEDIKTALSDIQTRQRALIHALAQGTVDKTQ